MIRQRGFTLLELLVAMSILAILGAMVYGTFFGVAESTETTRTANQDMRVSQFLQHHATQSLSQATHGWLPGAMARTLHVDLGDQETPPLEDVFLFLGEDDSSFGGPTDTLTFVSAAPIAGMPSPPGFLKRVRYEILRDGGDEGSMIGAIDGHMNDVPVFQATETPILGRMNDEDDELFEDVESPLWKIPAWSMDIHYFDGEEWHDEWDTEDTERMPWLVDIRIDLVQPEEIDSSLDVDRPYQRESWEPGLSTAADIHFVVTIPQGVGVIDPPLYWAADNRRVAGAALEPPSWEVVRDRLGL